MSPPQNPLLKQAQAAHDAIRADPDTARRLATEVLTQAGPQDRAARALALLVQAKLWHRETKYAESLQLCRESLDLARAIDDPELMARSLNMLGLSHHALANDPVALEHFQESVRMAEKAGDDAGVIMATGNTAMVMHAQGDREAALEIYRTLVDNPKVQADHRISAQTRHNFAQTSWDLGRDLPACAEAFTLAAADKRAIGDRWSLILTLCSLSGVFRDMGKFEPARETLTEVAALIEAEPSHELQNLYQLNLGVWFLTENNPSRDFEAAQAALKIAVRAAQDGQMSEEEARSREHLAEARIAAGRHVEACTELKAAATIRQQIQQDRSRRQIERLRVAFEAERAHHEAHHERSLREAAETFNIQIREQNRQLESVNQEKTDIIGLISHDLRAPLAAAVELTMDLIDNPHDHENVLGSGEALLTSQRQMLDLTQSLLDIEALESGALKAPSNDQNLDALFTELTASHRAAIRTKDLQIVRQLPAQTRAWHGPRLLLERAIENLFSNAIKYSPHGTRVTLAAEWETNGLAIRISDTGPGVSFENRARMFEKFATLGTAPTGGESTHGLGLYLARCCAQHAGGDIHYEDTPGGGATFVLTLPNS